MNPESKKYTWSRRTPRLVASRLDMLWISHQFLQLTQASCINNGCMSDHAIIELK